MMGGEMSLESAVGRGSTFLFSANFGAKRSALDAPARPPVELRGLRVLVVDDHATTRQVLEEVLAGWEMRPRLAASGQEALAALKQAAAESTPFELVLVDGRLLDMDGVELIDRLRRVPEGAGAKVVLLAVEGAGESARRAELRIGAFLRKPVKQSELLEAIQQVIGVGGPAGPAPAPPPVRNAWPRGILLVEDNPVNQQVAQRILQDWGHTVTVANNGREALEALERARFDLILMDVQMPEMDGLQATAAIRQREKGERVPIIGLTAHAMKGDRERCLAAGMDGYVSKPIDTTQLFQAIERTSAAKPASAQPEDDGFDEAESLRRAGGDRALLRFLIELFLSSCDGELEQINSALSAKGDRLRRATHDFKGHVGAFSRRAMDLARILEERAQEGEPEKVVEAWEALRSEVGRLRPALERWLAR
jgi:CheY-like chemotaxis protein/HPt (histidine-containing phosphotransfer) domain-containing protein